MQKDKDMKIPFPLAGYAFDEIISGLACFDPMGSYTGRATERDEIPVQDADDL